jgi:hypothetical protein
VSGSTIQRRCRPAHTLVLRRESVERASDDRANVWVECLRIIAVSSLLAMWGLSVVEKTMRDKGITGWPPERAPVLVALSGVLLTLE